MSIFRQFGILLIVISAAGSTLAHEFHTTFMTIDQNLADKNLEVSLKIFRHDLEPVLERRLKKQVDFGDGDTIDKALFEYVKEKFEISTGEKRLEPKWVGKEVDAQVIFVYFEIPFDAKLNSAVIRNTLFFEKFKEQVNYVTIKSGERKIDLVFKVGGKPKLTLELAESGKGR
jgi:hypothetical protein